MGSTYLATSDGCAQWVVADTDLFIDDVVGKVVPTTGHCTDEDGDGVRLREGRQVFRQPDSRCVAGQC